MKRRKADFRFVHVSDLHLSEKPPFQGVNADRFFNMQTALLNDLTLCKPNLIVISGDVFHNRSNQDLVPGTPERLMFALFLSETRRKKISVVIVAGNHDYDNLGRCVLDEYRCEFPNVDVVSEDLETILNREGFNVRCISWAARRQKPKRSFFTHKMSGLTILVMHTDISGLSESASLVSSTGMSIVAIEKLIEEGHIDYAALGHYHYPYCTERINMLGTPMPRNFDENRCWECSYAVIDWWRDDFSTNYNRMPRLNMIEVNLDEGTDFEGLRKNLDKCDVVKVRAESEEVFRKASKLLANTGVIAEYAGMSKVGVASHEDLREAVREHAEPHGRGVVSAAVRIFDKAEESTNA